MIHLINDKDVTVLKPQSVTAGATVTARIDKLGYDYMGLIVTLDSQGSTSSNPSTFKLSESDDTTTTITDITAFVGGTAAGNFATQAADTSNPQRYRFNVDLRARKRYLTLTLAVQGSTQLLGAHAILSRAEIAPSTDTLAGDTLRIFG